MKQVVIVAPHFPPSNLAAGHRSRYFAMHLPKFGWQVKVLSVLPAYYEEKLDPELAAIMPDNFEIIRTHALPTRPIRLIGDLGIRSFWWHYRTLVKLIKQRAVDLIYTPIPPNYTGLLGPLLHQQFGIPYAIDYIDPWISQWKGYDKPFTKAWVAYHLNYLCEPIALRNTRLLTGVAPKYYEEARQRYSWMSNVPHAAMPYGAEPSEYTYLDAHPRPPSLFDPTDGKWHFVYAGVMWEQASDTLEALLMALARLKADDPGFAERLRFHFVGTGNRTDDPNSFTVKPRADNHHLGEMVKEHPARIAYLDVLNNLKHAHAGVIIGSWQAHYSPSKVFQLVLARRQVLAILHAQSTAVEILRDAGVGVVVTYDENHPAQTKVEDIALAIQRACNEPYSADQVQWHRFEQYSAEAMAQQLAAAFDRVIAHV